MHKATSLLLACALVACGAPDVCLEAAEHASQCTGIGVPAVRPEVPAAQCEAVLATSCEQLAQDAVGGKADGLLCRWFGWFCPQPTTPEPPAQPAPEQLAPDPEPYAPGVCPAAELPSEFELKETGWSVFAGSGYTSFAIRASGRAIGKVEENIWSWTRSFEYRDADDRLVAQAKEKAFSWGVQVDISDCDGRKLGTLKEVLHKSLFKVQTTYSVLDADGEQIATSEKHDWITTDFLLKDPSGREVAAMHRPWSFGGDTWEVSILEREALDARLYVMIGAFKTSVDKQRREEAAAAAAAADDE